MKNLSLRIHYCLLEKNHFEITPGRSVAEKFQPDLPTSLNLKFIGFKTILYSPLN